VCIASYDDGHDHTGQVEGLEQGHERGDLVGLGIHRDLPLHYSGGVVDRCD